MRGKVKTELSGWFDNWTAGGTGNSKESLDEQWEAQQEILRNRRKPKDERDKYFADIEARRKVASEKQQDMLSWQTKKYDKGEDPLDEWKRRRANGSIGDLDYGDEDKKGGIPLPQASFGIGGEFGVGGRYDNGGRFDLRLPYADQGYVDEDADFIKKLGGMFGGGKKGKPQPEKSASTEAESPKKNNLWPF